MRPNKELYTLYKKQNNNATLKEIQLLKFKNKKSIMNSLILPNSKKLRPRCKHFIIISDKNHQL